MCSSDLQLEYERKRLTRNERAYWLSFFRRFSQSVVKNRRSWLAAFCCGQLFRRRRAEGAALCWGQGAKPIGRLRAAAIIGSRTKCLGGLRAASPIGSRAKRLVQGKLMPASTCNGYYLTQNFAGLAALPPSPARNIFAGRRKNVPEIGRAHV